MWLWETLAGTVGGRLWRPGWAAGGEYGGAWLWETLAGTHKWAAAGEVGGAWLWETLAGTHKWAAGGEYSEKIWEAWLGSVVADVGGAWLWGALVEFFGGRGSRSLGGKALEPRQENIAGVVGGGGSGSVALGDPSGHCWGQALGALGEFFGGRGSGRP